MGTYSISLISVIFFTFLWTPALSNDKCDLSCQGSSSAPSFLAGHLYNYGVEGEVSIYLNGADKEETKVKIFGQVSVSAQGNCALSLKVNSLGIAGPDGKKYPAPKGIEKVVRFSLQDGRIGPEICAEADDTRASLNIKRAIISLLQTEQKPSTQIDVFGACPTEVSSSQEGSSMLVHRSRDLSRCAHREQTQNELITAVYNNNAEIKDTQLLRSTLNVESKVNNGVPEKISAVEQYLYRPFSVGENGARAEVNTKLTLTGTSAGGVAGICPVSRTIIFENPHQGEESHSNYQNIFNAVKETCKALGNEASSKSAGSFAQLVRILRSGNKADLLKVFGQIKGNNLEKRVFLDGLLRAGTGYSIEASIQILKSKELSPLEEKIVFLSLGNAKHVTGDAIKAAAGLLDLPNLPKSVYLGVGALAGIYCRDHNCHTEKNEGIIALSKKLGAKLQNCKPKTKVEEDAVIAVLKGIRNIRHLEDSLIDRLVRCASDNTVKARVRVSALEAFQGDACAAKLKKTAIEIMKNRQLDSEIRIKAYLAVITCPCGKSANEIKNLLESEPVHQVGRFISTSLRAIRASANPDKKLARQHYGLIGIPNRFNVDDRKYSFYREMSYNVDAIGVGGNVESSVIYSQDSFLPRSVNMNVTAEVFGHNVNVLEVGGRQGNLDRVLEHFLGPKSFLRTQKPQEIYDTIRQKFDESYNKVEKSVRGRRSIKSEVDNFDKQIKAESLQYNHELDLDVYIKLFGTDAVFLSLGDDKGYDFNSFLDESLKTLNEGMNKMKNFQQELRGHVLFLDAELAYPTSTGLPLKLDAVGSATGRFEVSSNVDIRQILRTPEASKIDFKLIPSTDIEVSLVMMVDAECLSTGLKVVTNLHSSTGGHVVFKIIENGKGFDLQLGLPIEKQEILTASNELVFFSAERGQMEKLTPIKSEKNEYSGCFDQLSGMLGVTFCGKVTLPFSLSGQKSDNAISAYLTRFPLVGSSKVNVVLEKNDIHGYHIKGVFHREGSPNRRYGMELLFDAEGKQNRRTQFIGEIIDNDQEKTIKASLDSPIKKLNGQFSLYTKPSEYALMMKAQMDDAIYYGRAGVNIAGNERRSVYKPVLEYQLPGENGKKTISVDGQITRENTGDNVKYTLDGVKFNIPNSNEPVNIEGHFNSGQKMIETDLKLKKGQQNMLFSGSIKGNDCKLEFMNTLNPYINFKLSGHIENTRDSLHNDIDLYYGGDCRNPQNRVTINQLYKRHYISIEDYNIITKNKIEIHALPIKAHFNLETDPKKFDLDVGGVYFTRKGNLNIDARTHLKKAGDYRIKTVMSVDQQSVEALIKRDIVSPDKSNVENYIDFKNIGKYELSGVVLHKVKEHDMNVGAVGHLKISGSGKDEEIKFDVGVIETANQYSSHATISNLNGELLNYLLKVNCGNNPNGQLKFNLKDAIAANGQYQVTDNDGKGNGNIMVHFKKLERIIKADVKFVAKDPVFNAEVDLYLNFEKDNNDKVHLSTNNKKTDRLLDSKNKIQYAGKSSEINIHKDGLFTGLGKDGVNVEVVLPDERCLNLKFDRDVNLNDNVYNGHAELLFSDAPKRGGPASIISYKGKLAKANIDKEEIDYEGQVELKLKDGKNLLNTFSFKNIPKGDSSDMAFKSEVSGNMLPKKAMIDASASYTQQDRVKENYRVKASYGDNLATELVGAFEAIMPDKGEKKYMNDYTMTIRLPFEQAHDIKLVSTFMFLQPENKAAEVTIIESVQVNADLYKLESNGKYHETSGNNKVKVIVPHVEPIIVDVNYKYDQNKDKTSGDVNLKAQYGKGKSTSLSLQGTSSANEIELKIMSNSPQNEKLKKFVLTLHAKNPSPDTYNALIAVDADGRVYQVEGLTIYSTSQPVFDLKYSSPSSPKTRFYFKGVQIRSNQGRGEMKIENIKDFNFESSVEYDFEKNFAIKYQANAEKLGMKNYKVEITSKDAGSGKRLEFTAVNDGKNVLSGSTSFISKQEGPKTIIEGSGTLKIKDEQKPASFKYIRTILTEGNEQGMETFINVAFGERNHVAESRITNMEYKASYVYCEEKKQCAHAELNSKFITSKPGCLQHQYNMGFDLRKLGLNTEFGLQINNEFSEKNLPQYDMNLHVNRENDKFHFHVYSQPELGKFPAGIVLTFPKRVVAIEGLVHYPTDKAMPFPIKAELNMYPDKNRPQSKTSLRFNMDASIVRDEQGEMSAVIGFSHPRIGREALIKFHGSVKRPSENSIVIDTSSVISHSCLGNDREAKFHFEGSPTAMKLLIDTPVVKLIEMEGFAAIKEDNQRGDLRFSLLEGKPVEVHVLINDYKYYEFSTGYSGDSGNRLSITSHLDPEKRVDASIDIVLPGKKTHNIAHGALFLENNLINSDYGMSKDNYNNFVKALKKDMVDLQKRVGEVGEKTNNDFKQTMKKVEPTYKKLREAYEADLNSFRNDLQEIMKSMQESYESIRHIIQAFLKIFDDIVDLIKPVADQIAETVTSISKKVVEMYEKQLEPQLKQLYESLSAVVKEYTDGIIDVAAHIAAIAIDFFEKHKGEIRELANVFTEIFKDLTRIIVAQLKEFRGKSAQFFSELMEQIKNMPIIGLIKEKYQELAVPEQFLGLMKEAHQAIRAVMPTEEIKLFLDALDNYAQKKLRQEKFDERAELRTLYERLAAAAASLVRLVRQHVGQLGITYPMISEAGFPGITPMSIPSLRGSAALSFINQLIEGDMPDPMKLIQAYRPRSFNPLDEIPSKMRAVVVNGQHIFTFDGRHMTFPGSCRYVLVHDHVDRNFTLIMQLANGNPKALILEDKSGITIELKENGQAALNGASHGYPIIEEDVFAFREPNGRIGLGSRYGLMAFCTSKLEVCYIDVNGFYLGKLRGLLGDGNNEPFDDFRLPNGKIVNSESDFGNAYRLAGSCAVVKTPEHSHQQMHQTMPPACETVFGGSSPLRALTMVLDVMPFRQACIHACTGSENALSQACDLARGYAALAQATLLPAVLPPQCVKCTDSDKPREVGETYDVKLPAKQADIIVSVEVTTANEKNYKDIVVPLVSQIIDQLKSKRITDVKVYLVGVTSKYPYPILYDTDLRLKSAKVKFDDESRYNLLEPIDFKNKFIDGYENLLVDIVNKLSISFGVQNIMATYHSIFDLPLRPAAVKHYISAVGTKCEPQLFILNAARSVVIGEMFKNMGMTHSLITDVDGLKIGGGKSAEQVVGFSKSSVLMLGDKKQKDTEALRATLELPNEDNCVDFTEESGGYTFSASNFRKMNPQQQKQFIASAASSVTSRLLQDSLSLSCTCSYTDPFRVRSLCVVTDRKEVARKRK